MVKKNKAKLDLLNGDIDKTLFKLALPMIIGLLFHTAFNIVDTIFVGRLGPENLAAMTFSFPVAFIIIALAGGIGVGVNSLISRYLGAGKNKEADNAAEHGFLLAFIVYAFIVVFNFFFAESLFRFLGAEGEMLNLLLQYISVIFYGSIFMLIPMIGNNILRAEGNSKLPMVVMAISAVVNIVLDPIFIFGFAFIPAMGIKGAAIATIISRFVGTIIVIEHLVVNKKSDIKLDLRDFKYKWSIIKNIFVVGIPASLTQMIISLGMFAFNSLIIVMGQDVLAAFGAYFRLESLAFLPVIGISNAVITMVGQNYGAKKYDRIPGIVKAAVKYGTLIMVSVGILFFVFPEIFFKLFTDDLGLIALGRTFMKVLPLAFFFIPFSMIGISFFQGIGKGVFPLVYHVARIFLLSVPFMYFFGVYKDMGLVGALGGWLIGTFVMFFVSVYVVMKELNKIKVKA